jgi:Mn-dependent DtxR family transcriptional regulator
MSARNKEFASCSRAVLATLWQAQRPLPIGELATRLNIQEQKLEPILQAMAAQDLVKINPGRLVEDHRFGAAPAHINRKRNYPIRT